MEREKEDISNKKQMKLLDMENTVNKYKKKFTG